MKEDEYFKETVKESLICIGVFILIIIIIMMALISEGLIK